VGKRIILLVEDSPADEALSVRELQKLAGPPEVVVARDGAEALDYLFAAGKYEGRAPGDLPAVVILDLHLPLASGLEVLQRARADPRTRCVPIVIFTSSESDEELVRAYQLGCNSFVRKAATAAEFRAAMGQMGSYWLFLNQPPPFGRAR